VAVMAIIQVVPENVILIPHVLAIRVNVLVMVMIQVVMNIATPTLHVLVTLYVIKIVLLIMDK
jgi:hypothetical protein